MECPMCLELFDQDARRPKVLPCGHTVCLACLLQLKQHVCPTCRKELPQGRVNDLPDNYILLGDSTGRQPERRWWCSTCRAVAKSSCEEDLHALQHPRPALRWQVVQVQEQLPQLQQEVHEQLQALAAADTAEDKALAGLQCLGGAGTTCKLELCRDGEPSYGAKWSVSEAALKDKLLRALALVLVQDGELTQQEVGQGCGPQQQAQQQGLQHAQDVVQGRGPQLQSVQRAQEVVRVPVAGIEELNVDDALLTEDKPAMLRRVTEQGVRRMVNVRCDTDPAWILELLRCAAPMVEGLQVSFVTVAQLLAVHGMPRLRRLDVDRNTGDDDSFPDVLPPLPADHPGLQRLYMDLPRQTTIALLQAHGHSLQELVLKVGTGPHSGGWPFDCEDLPSLLRRCGMRALRRLVLDRPSHSDVQCRAQLYAARRVLPVVTVECDRCDVVSCKF